jgi:hypothetical protein
MFIWILKLYFLHLLQIYGCNIVNMAFFIIFDEQPSGQGYCKGFTSMRGVSGFTGIKYDTLVHHFTREKRRWHYYDEKGIKVIKVDDVERGRQRVHRKQSGHNRNI